MIELLSRLFVKNREDTQSPTVRRAYGTMVSITGMILNVLLFVAKFTIGTLTGSVSITADAINNLSDAGSQIISLISFRISAKPADREHPFGHARIEYVASMIVSFLILLIGVELLQDSIQKIITPEPPEHSYVTVGILAGSILVKLWMALLNKRIGKRIDSSVMQATAADSLSDVLSTSAVLVAALVLLLFPDLNWNLDAYMGVIVAALILWAGLKILNETKNAILGEAPTEEIVNTITKIVKKYPEALGIHDLRVHNYGPGHAIVSLHVEVDGKDDVFHTHDVIDNIERELWQIGGMEATIHMDPIVVDDEQVTKMRETVARVVSEIDPAIHIHDFRFVAGETHTNLIFDVEAPFELPLSDEELRRVISDRISRINPSFFTVITVDRM